MRASVACGNVFHIWLIALASVSHLAVDFAERTVSEARLPWHIIKQLLNPQVPFSLFVQSHCHFLFSINCFWQLFIPLISSWIVKIYCVSFSQWGWKHASWPFSVDPTPCCSYTRSAQTTSGLPPHCRTQPPRPSLTEPWGQPAERQQGRRLNIKKLITSRPEDLFYSLLHIFCSTVSHKEELRHFGKEVLGVK